MPLSSAERFLANKRRQQAASRVQGYQNPLAPAPSIQERYGANAGQPMGIGKYTGAGEDGKVQPSMATERRISVDGKPYAVDEGEVLVANNNVVNAYGGPRGVENFLVNNMPKNQGQAPQAGSQGPMLEGASNPNSQASVMQDVQGAGMGRFKCGGIPRYMGGGIPRYQEGGIPSQAGMTDLDKMRSNRYLSRAGAMAESERAGEAQRLRQEGATSRDIRGIQAISDVSRRSALGDIASDLAESEAAGAERRGQFAQQLGLQNRQFQESQRQFDTGVGLQREQMGEQARQFDVGTGLTREQMGEQARQFDVGTGLTREQMGEQTRQFDVGMEQRAAEFGAQMGLSRDQFMEAVRQYDQGMDLQNKQLEENIRRFNEELGQRKAEFGTTTGLTREQMEEQRRQFDVQADQRAEEFGAQFGLSKEQFQEAVRQYDEGMDLQNAQLEEGVRRFNEEMGQRQTEFQTTTGLSREQLEEQQRQFDAQKEQRADEFASNLGLSRDQFDEAVRQHKAGETIANAQLAQAADQFSREMDLRESEFGALYGEKGLERQRFDLAREQYQDTQEWQAFDQSSLFGSDQDVIDAYKAATGQDLDPSAVQEVRGYTRQARLLDLQSTQAALGDQQYASVEQMINSGASYDMIKERFPQVTQQQYDSIWKEGIGYRQQQYEEDVRRYNEGFAEDKARYQDTQDWQAFQVASEMGSDEDVMAAYKAATGKDLDPTQVQQYRDYSKQMRQQAIEAGALDIVGTELALGDAKFQSAKNMIDQGATYEQVSDAMGNIVSAPETGTMLHNEVFLQLPTEDKQKWIDEAVNGGATEFTDSTGKTWMKAADGKWGEAQTSTLSREQYNSMRDAGVMGERDFNRNMGMVDTLLQTGGTTNIVEAQNLMNRMFPDADVNFTELIREEKAADFNEGMQTMTQLIASGLTYEEAVPALINSQAVKNMGIGGNAMKSMYETLKLNTNPVYKLTSTLTDQQLTEMFPDQTPSKTRSMIAKLSMFGAMTLNPDGTFGWDMDLLNEMGMGMPKTGDVTTISVTAAGGTATGTGGTATGTGGTGVGGTATTTSFEDATGTTDQGGTGTGYTQGDPSDPNTVFEPGTTTTQTTVHGDPQFEPFTVVTDQPGQYQIPSIPGTSKVVDDGINYMVHYLNQGKSWEEIEAGLFNDYRYEDGSYAYPKSYIQAMKEFVIANNMATGPAPTTNGMTAQQIADWEAAYGSPIGGSQAPTADQTTGITHNEVFLKLPTSDKQAWLDMVVKLGKDTFTDSSGKTWRKLPDGTWTDSAIGLDQPQSSDYQYDPAFIPSWGS